MFNLIAYAFMAVFAAICLFPFLLIVSGAFSDEQAILRNGYTLIPEKLSLNAFHTLFTTPEDIIRSYGVTLLITVIGTAAGLFFSTMAAYVLQRKLFKPRNIIAFLLYFTTIFDGGIVPRYILMIRYLHLKNSIFSLIFPLLLNVFNIIIIRSTISSSIPESLSESAEIDGAGEFCIFLKIVLPLSKPILATIGLFIALGYWNDWFNAMLYINVKDLTPLQYYLYKMLSQITMIRELVSKVPQMATTTPPEESFKMAMTLVTIVPIILVYPFVQRYFVSGIMIGAVKG